MKHYRFNQEGRAKYKELDGRYITEKICPVCGKNFVPAPFHAYKEDQKTFCCWTCLCKYRKQKEAERIKRRKSKISWCYSEDFKNKAISMVINEKRASRSVAKELNVHESTLNRWIAEYKDYKNERESK